MIGLDGGPLTVRAESPGGPGQLDAAGLAGTATGADWVISRAEGTDRAGYHRLRREVFVDEQGLFVGNDEDDLDRADTTVVLVARDRLGAVIGGVRVAPVGGEAAAGWWTGSRLVVRADHRGDGRRAGWGPAVGVALVRAACAVAEESGALRFDASVQREARPFFERLGWIETGEVVIAGRPHVAMRRPIGRAQQLADATKAPLAAVLDGLAPGGRGWIGDDAAPVAGSDLLAACDAIMPAMVERDPQWAGWCGVLVNVNDLSAMGAEPVALLDAVAAPTAAAAALVVEGLRRAAAAWGVPVIGGHTQIGVPAALAVTAIGRTATPVPGGGGRPGDDVVLTVDLAGGWRPGYTGRQWDSTTRRSPAALRHLAGLIGRWQPAAAKDVSMAGIIGTLGMLAEASGCGAELEVARVPQPAGTVAGDWLTCFPGFAMLSADRRGRTRAVPSAGGAPASCRPATSAVVGRLVTGSGVTLVWPDGQRTLAVAASVSGLGPASGP